MTFKCSLCTKEFLRQQHLQRHLASVHVAENEHVCTTCFRSFSRRDALQRHQSKHEAVKDNNRCEECNKVFTRKDALLRHMKNHRPGPVTSERPHKKARLASDDLLEGALQEGEVQVKHNGRQQDDTHGHGSSIGITTIPKAAPRIDDVSTEGNFFFITDISIGRQQFLISSLLWYLNNVVV